MAKSNIIVFSRERKVEGLCHLKQKMEVKYIDVKIYLKHTYYQDLQGSQGKRKHR